MPFWSLRFPITSRNPLPPLPGLSVIHISMLYQNYSEQLWFPLNEIHQPQLLGVNQGKPQLQTKQLIACTCIATCTCTCTCIYMRDSSAYMYMYISFCLASASGLPHYVFQDLAAIQIFFHVSIHVAVVRPGSEATSALVLHKTTIEKLRFIFFSSHGAGLTGKATSEPSTSSMPLCTYTLTSSVRRSP